MRHLNIVQTQKKEIFGVQYKIQQFYFYSEVVFFDTNFLTVDTTTPSFDYPNTSLMQVTKRCTIKYCLAQQDANNYKQRKSIKKKNQKPLKKQCYKPQSKTFLFDNYYPKNN
eukprot:TRINITY_DN315_c0_g5_i1.p1 TRINITY_DN315_c0_g5~~TRINITY_DN315_c0_g5_i1.p1  ORF type:complete len:112 (+),score=0.66 TRINITY_DN315_c0_g5_i1:428-763(+)